MGNVEKGASIDGDTMIDGFVKEKDKGNVGVKNRPTSCEI
jgi:hypothetical protein